MTPRYPHTVMSTRSDDSDEIMSSHSGSRNGSQESRGAKPKKLTLRQWNTRREARKQLKSVSFRTTCDRLKIPYPVHCNLREQVHLNQCQNCQDLWKSFLFVETYLNQKDLDVVSREFLEMPEDVRRALLPSIRRTDELWLQKHMKRRTPTAHQIYAKEYSARHRVSKDDQRTGRDNQMTALIVSNNGGHEWTTLTSDQKKPYHDKALELKQRYLNECDKLPDYKKVQIRRRKKQDRLLKPDTFNNTSTGSFIKFVSKQWKLKKVNREIQEKGYNTFRDECIPIWNSMSLEDKKSFE